MDGLAWLLLEAGVALALLLFIVWWTWPRRKPPEGGEGDPKPPRGRDGNHGND